MKATEPASHRDRIRVWRPAGFRGLEVGVKQSPVALRFVPSLVFDYRLVLNGHGRARVRFGTQSYCIEDVRDCVFLQHPGEVFQGTFDGNVGASGACIGLSEDLIAELHGEQPSRRWRFPRMVPEDRYHAVLAVLTRAALCALQHPTSLLERQSKLIALVETASRTSATRADASVWTAPRRSERRAVAAVKRYFHDLPSVDHSMHDLARLTGLNPRYLIRVFRQQTGLTPHRYLTALRIWRSKDLLLTDRSLSSVALDLGFADQAHFTRVFKAYVQVSPGQFRRLSGPSSPGRRE